MTYYSFHLFLLLFISLLTVSNTKQCESGDFKCSDRNGRWTLPASENCTFQSLVCDGYPDCPFGDDEHNCPGCNDTGWICPSTGDCVPSRWTCATDSIIWDCPLQDDVNEQNCGICTNYNSPIPSENLNWRCSDNGRCIPKQWLCDCEIDCLNGEDEHPSICGNKCLPNTTSTMNPTFILTIMSTFNPTYSPTINPTFFPSNNPTFLPTINPTFLPSNNPTYLPTVEPTFLPSINPSNVPSINPTNYPSIGPTYVPTHIQTISPTYILTSIPTSISTPNPTQYPISISISTQIPTVLPTIKLLRILTIDSMLFQYEIQDVLQFKSKFSQIFSDFLHLKNSMIAIKITCDNHYRYHHWEDSSLSSSIQWSSSSSDDSYWHTGRKEHGHRRQEHGQRRQEHGHSEHSCTYNYIQSKDSANTCKINIDIAFSNLLHYNEVKSFIMMRYHSRTASVEKFEMSVENRINLYFETECVIFNVMQIHAKIFD